MSKARHEDEEEDKRIGQQGDKREIKRHRLQKEEKKEKTRRQQQVRLIDAKPKWKTKKMTLK